LRVALLPPAHLGLFARETKVFSRSAGAPRRRQGQNTLSIVLDIC